MVCTVLPVPSASQSALLCFLPDGARPISTHCLIHVCHILCCVYDSWILHQHDLDLVCATLRARACASVAGSCFRLTRVWPYSCLTLLVPAVAFDLAVFALAFDLALACSYSMFTHNALLVPLAARARTRAWLHLLLVCLSHTRSYLLLLAPLSLLLLLLSRQYYVKVCVSAMALLLLDPAPLLLLFFT